MLLDIVPLVDRWTESKRRVDCSTFGQRCVNLDYDWYSVGSDEIFFPVGREFDGAFDNVYRYKVIESILGNIIEYIAIGFEPINVWSLGKNLDKELIPISSRMYNFVEKERVVVHYFAQNIIDVLTELWTIPRVYCAACTSREAFLDELDRAGEKYNHPDLQQLVDESRDTYGLAHIIDAHEDPDLDKFFELGRCLMPLAWDDEALIYPWIRRSIVGDWNPPKIFGTSGYVRNALNRKIQIADVRNMLSGTFSVHPFTRRIPAAFSLTDKVQTNFGDLGNSLIYGLDKFIEQVPYTEFKIEGLYDNWEAYFGNVYYSCNMGHLVYNGKKDTDVFPRLIFNNIMQQLTTIAQCYEPNVEIEKMCIVRSFNEDVYITLMHKNGKTRRLYSDLVYTILGSRGVFTDYECSWFNN